MIDQWANWVLDASMGWPPCFCPIEGDIDGEYQIVIGMNFLGDPPGKLVAVIHESQEKADAFYAAHKAEIDVWLAPARSARAGTISATGSATTAEPGQSPEPHKDAAS